MSGAIYYVQRNAPDLSIGTLPVRDSASSKVPDVLPQLTPKKQPPKSRTHYREQMSGASNNTSHHSQTSLPSSHSIAGTHIPKHSRSLPDSSASSPRTRHRLDPTVSPHYHHVVLAPTAHLSLANAIPPSPPLAHLGSHTYPHTRSHDPLLMVAASPLCTPSVPQPSFASTFSIHTPRPTGMLPSITSHGPASHPAHAEAAPAPDAAGTLRVHVKQEVSSAPADTMFTGDWGQKDTLSTTENVCDDTWETGAGGDNDAAERDVSAPPEVTMTTTPATTAAVDEATIRAALRAEIAAEVASEVAALRAAETQLQQQLAHAQAEQQRLTMVWTEERTQRLRLCEEERVWARERADMQLRVRLLSEAACTHVDSRNEHALASTATSTTQTATSGPLLTDPAIPIAATTDAAAGHGSPGSAWGLMKAAEARALLAVAELREEQRRRRDCERERELEDARAAAARASLERRLEHESVARASTEKAHTAAVMQVQELSARVAALQREHDTYERDRMFAAFRSQMQAQMREAEAALRERELACQECAAQETAEARQKAEVHKQLYQEEARARVRMQEERDAWRREAREKQTAWEASMRTCADLSARVGALEELLKKQRERTSEDHEELLRLGAAAQRAAAAAAGAEEQTRSLEARLMVERERHEQAEAELASLRTRLHRAEREASDLAVMQAVQAAAQGGGIPYGDMGMNAPHAEAASATDVRSHTNAAEVPAPTLVEESATVAVARSMPLSLSALAVTSDAEEDSSLGGAWSGEWSAVEVHGAEEDEGEDGGYWGHASVDESDDGESDEERGDGSVSEVGSAVSQKE